MIKCTTMATGTIPPSWLDDTFKLAKEDFKRSLKNPALYDFSKLVSIDDVLEEAKKIERQQAKTRTLRGLRRVQPLINGLKEYSAIIEVFAQAKPDIISLIWGPLKFILQASSSVISAFEKVVKVIADVGTTLPSFKAYTQLFQSNHEIRRALCLFFADILDFYAILLNFLTSPTRNIILESLWPNIRSSITRVQENMDNHKAIMTTNVTLQDILLAHQARKRALEEYDQAQVFRDNQTFNTIRNELSPHDHDVELASILRRSSVVSGEWLRDEPDFMRWHDSIDRTARILWLCGIPGSGKTFIVGNLIKTIQSSGQRLVFALLSHNNQAAGDTIKVLHSFLFQLLDVDPSLRSLLHEPSQSNYRKLKTDSDFLIEFLCKILRDVGPTFVILDGLDELDECSWRHLLASVLKINESCPETKLLISSREERNIELRLRNKSIPIRVDDRNSGDIQSFVQLECESLLDEMRSCRADQQTCLEVKKGIDGVAEKAAGMFIYARLVMLMVKDHHDIGTQIQDLPDLPDGLDEVYGRLLDRAREKNRRFVRPILQWVACAQRPLSEEEMLQALSIEPGQQDFTKRRKQFLDICKMCGPIIEIKDGNIQFVHFSAKEYLLHEQSDSFLNLSEAHLDATIICATYLSLSSLNSLFSHRSNDEVDIQMRITDGDYVLFEYASMMFLGHLEAALETHNTAQDARLLAALSRFRETRSVDSPDTSCIPKHIIHMFRMYVDEPQVQDFLSIVMYSQTKAQNGMSNQDGVTGSPMDDPLNIFSTRRKVRKGVEDAICRESYHRPSCCCNDLMRLYGANVYHCDQHFCHAYQRGFRSKQLRDQHLKIHQRPHKCSIDNCLFTDIGFYDTPGLERHMRDTHPSSTLGNDVSGPVVSPGRPLNDTYGIFKDAVALDQVDLVRELIDRGVVLKNSEFYSNIVGLAASKSSKDMLSCLLGWQCGYEAPYLSILLAMALEFQNLPNIGFLFSYEPQLLECMYAEYHLGVGFIAPGRTRSSASSSGMSHYVRALSLWSPTLMAYLINECCITVPLQVKRPGRIFADAAIMEDTLDQARKRFHEIKQYIIWPEAYVEGVAMASEWRCFTGAMICLENGGDPNGNRQFSRRTALFHAVEAGSRQGAQFVKELLRNGADLNHPGFKVKSNSAMAKKTAGHFGLTWEEMVRRLREGEDLPIISRRNNNRNM
ncbi:uncharacterized protein GGS22DRAFT_153217 [Annulohypoxylon maeteangense]|uniref:uncharacterized protein n=1 Tax=Annulohypoxylon maeteangense TaxID=1927788 RepID=UPI0020072284|nr:uncharacterized protein GGS22DRAFT_153217 [Annulohypoxylon maeteangense]KAI0889136.1 hypothetical protein GGS22DRAFT_153217 [Annulohypoxylon maeteangense]